MTNARNIARNQQGFTLIEIIAVLILLGILAAVAVPKFMGMQSDAQAKAIDGALAAGVSNATMAYSKFLLTNGSAPTSISSNAWSDGSNTQAIETDLGDFTASYSYNTTTKEVTVTLSAGPSWFSGYSGSKSKTFTIQ